MDKFLAGYERDIEVGAGLAVGPGADKVVLHTTESPRGSYNGVRNLWRGPQNWGRGLPHFLADGKRWVQLLPLDVNAYTMENKSGGVDTNRAGHVIQVEMCGYAKNGIDEETQQALGKWLADLVKAGLKLNLGQHPRFYGSNEGIVLASYGSPIRLQGKAYEDFNGFLGHQHAPENAHWDPGFLDGRKIEDIARKNLGSTPEEEEEMKTVLATDKRDNKTYAVWGLFKRHLSPADYNLYKFFGVQDLGKLEGNFFDALTTVPRGSIAGI